jgi:arylsulfatase A
LILLARIFVLALAITTLCPCIAAAGGAGETKPNFVFILIDDMGQRDLGCYGSTFYKTPNIDRLAAKGMKFTDAYSACPVCSPTRASILTGKYPARLHLTDFIPGGPSKPSQKLLRPPFRHELPLEEVTLAEALKPAGYVSAAIGKWHLGKAGFEPEQQGFDFAFAGNQRGGEPDSKEQGKGEYDLTTQAEKFIEKNKSKPFFLYLPYWSVHIPLLAKQELVEKYEKRISPGQLQTNATYAAMIESLDTCVGRITRKLEKLHLSERTIIFFTSDNGGLSVHEGPNTPATSNFPLRDGKGYLHEGGIRDPLIVVWPGVVKAGSQSQQTPMISIDYFPTILEMAGIKSHSQIDGLSFVPLLKQTGKFAHDALYWHYPHYSNQGGSPGGAIRVGDFKLIENYEDGRLELFNLKDDIGEQNDLSETMPDKVLQLEGKLDLWRRQVQAQMMLPNPDYEL